MLPDVPISYLVEDGQLFVNGKQVYFDHKIYDAERDIRQINNLLIIVLNIEKGQEVSDEEYSRNIYALNERGEILWQIEAPRNEETGASLAGQMTYTGVSFSKEDIEAVSAKVTPQAIVCDTSGFRYSLNLKDGTVKFLYNSQFG